jgi:uncharacterized protein
MHLDGAFAVKIRQIEAYRFLIDPSRIAKHMPDVEEVQIENENNFVLKAKVGVSHIKGTMTMKLQVVEKQEPTSAKVIGKGTGMASVIDMVTNFTLDDAGEGMTLIRWSGEANIGGKLASLGGGLLERMAKKNVEKFIAGIQEGLENM